MKRRKSLDKIYVTLLYCENIPGCYWITSTHILPLPSLRWKVFHFLLSRVNKLALVNILTSPPPPPPRKNVTLLLSHQSISVCKAGMAGIANRVYFNIWNLLQSRTYFSNSLRSVLGNFGKNHQNYQALVKPTDSIRRHSKDSWKSRSNFVFRFCCHV